MAHYRWTGIPKALVREWARERRRPRKIAREREADQHGLNTLKHQPMKIAAIEAHWDGSLPGELVLFAWPDEKAETNRFAVTIPHGASIMLTHSWDGLFPGLTSVPPQDRPPVLPPFFAFRAMVGIGLLMILTALTGVWLWWRGRLFSTRWYLWPAQHVWWIGFVAVICGWIVTETGRQPWVAYGLLRTADAVSPLAGHTVATTLVLFVLVYGVVFAMGLLHQPLDRARTAGSRDRAPRHRNAGAATSDRRQSFRRDRIINFGSE